jgi:hypothetical protein
MLMCSESAGGALALKNRDLADPLVNVEPYVRSHVLSPLMFGLGGELKAESSISISNFIEHRNEDVKNGTR